MLSGRSTLLAAVAITVALATAVAAYLIGRQPRCAQTALSICQVKIGHAGCLPGPCDLARHHAAVQRAITLAVGWSVAAALLGLALRERLSPRR